MEQAREKYMEGKDSVPHHQQRLFLNFEHRIEGRTQAIANWIELVEIAQERRKEELKQLAQQPNLFQYNFTQEKVPQRNQVVDDIDRQTETGLHISTEDMRNKWAQQDLRQLFLRPNPNVRKKT